MGNTKHRKEEANLGLHTATKGEEPALHPILLFTLPRLNFLSF